MSRTTRYCLGLVILAVLLLPVTTLAQNEPNGDTRLEVDPFDLADLDWLVGYWVGEGFGGVCEEFWSPPVAGSMLGTFKMSDGGNQVTFYEIFTLTVDSAGLPQIKLKHFNADMTGWEKKDDYLTFSYKSKATNEITIGAVTYRNPSPDSLYVDVVLRNSAGEVNTETIRFKRVPL